MFTGLVEALGRIDRVHVEPAGRTFEIEAPFAEAVRAGDSVLVSGVCLTAEGRNAESLPLLRLAAVAETLRRTTAGDWRRGTRVHLERALAAGQRFGGHLVQGHVDGTGRVLRAGREGREFVLRVALPAELRRYVVSKGSLAVDGVSLTVGALRGGACRLYIVPETLRRTLIGTYRPGTRVNLEVDVLAKYVESLGSLPGRG